MAHLRQWILDTLVIPPMHAKMLRQRQKLPIKLHVPLSTLLHEVAFASFHKIYKDEDIEHLFGSKCSKIFERGSRAQLTEVTIEHLNDLSVTTTNISFYYQVFNQDNILQWPDEDGTSCSMI